MIEKWDRVTDRVNDRNGLFSPVFSTEAPFIRAAFA